MALRSERVARKAGSLNVAVTDSTNLTRPGALARPGAPSHRMVFVDVLRAIAILTVIIHHLSPDLGAFFGKLHEWGGRGVDLFFVLSGYLIGGTCLERADTSGTSGRLQQAKAYWLLRSARIFPLYFALLAAFALGLPGLNPEATFILRHWPGPFLTFTSNYFGQSSLELGVFWSLAIEEQFYLAVGLLILCCARRRETLAAAFLGLSLAAIAVSLVYRHELAHLHGDGLLPRDGYIFKLFHSTLSRMDQLALGLIASIASHALNGRSLARDERWVRPSTWGAIAVCLGVLVYFPDRPSVGALAPSYIPERPVAGFLVVGLVFCACLLWVQRPAARTLTLGRWEARLLWPLVYVGKLSFGLYLFHPITRGWVDALLPTSALPAGSGLRAGIFLVVWLGVTTALAAVSYRFFEDPILSAARRKVRQLLQARQESLPATSGLPTESQLTAPAAGPRAP